MISSVFSRYSRIIFFVVCFIVSDVTYIRMSGACFSSPCRGDAPGPYYLQAQSNLLLAPSALLSPRLQRTLGEGQTTTNWSAQPGWTYALPRQERLGFTIQFLLIDLPPIQNAQGKWLPATATTAVTTYLLQKLIILFSAPWWEALYRGLRWLKRRSRKAFIATSIIAVLVTLTSWLFMALGVAGDTVVTWPLIIDVLKGNNGATLEEWLRRMNQG